MKNLFLFIRHGESASNQILHENPNASKSEKDALIKEFNGDVPLTAKGVKQAELTGKFVASGLLKYPDAEIFVWSSQQQRAVETANEFLRSFALNNPPRELKVEMGDCQLQEFTRPHKAIGKVLPDNSSADFVKRIRNFKNSKIDPNSGAEGKIFLLFGHSVFFSVLLSMIDMENRAIPEQEADEKIVGASERMPITYHLPNCSITQVQRCTEAGRNWEVLGVANNSHLIDECGIDHRTGGHSLF